MRIENIRVEATETGRRLAALLVPEEGGFPSSTIYFAVDEAFGDHLELRAEPFLLAAWPLAAWRGERRIRVEGAVCPRLTDGLRAAALFFRDRGACRSIPGVEAAAGFDPPIPREPRRTGSFLSGGVDALALLRENLLQYPSNHPGRIAECLLIFGLLSFEFETGRALPERLDDFRRYRDSLDGLARAAGVTLVPLHTNVRTLYPDALSWRMAGFSAALLATGLVLSRRLTDLWMGSHGRGFPSDPLSMHPLLPPCYSTAATRAAQGQVAMSRLEKVRLVAGWEPGLRVLRSCFGRELPSGGHPNCGRCAKCLRTMLALLAAGVDLARAPTFPPDALGREALAGFRIEWSLERAYVAECVEPLERVGRPDLADVLRGRIADYDARARRENAGWRRAFRHLKARRR